MALLLREIAGNRMDIDHLVEIFKLCGIKPVSYTHLDVYKRQAAVHKEKTGLSRFGEEDRLIPVFTLVLYYGTA